MLYKFREGAKRVKEIFYNRYFDKSDEFDVKEAFKERKLALYFLVISAIVLLLKLSGHRVGDGQWMEKTATIIQSMLAFLLSLEWIATPILSGLAMAIITWCTVYLDSYLPGIHPPSPLSPKRFRIHSRTFHMGYYLAAINGILIAAVMLHSNLINQSTL